MEARRTSSSTSPSAATVKVNAIGISGASANSSLVVDGTTLVVNAASNYNGPATVHNSGVLVANAEIDTTNVTINAGSKLSGTSRADVAATLTAPQASTASSPSPSQAAPCCCCSAR